MDKLKIEYVPLKSIKPYEKNAKKHPEEQVEQIKSSIKEFGYLDPIGVWNDEIVEGHGRYEAAKQLGMKEIPIIRLDQLTDEQRRAYALVHNQLTMNSGWDFPLLDMELADISMDMEQFGFKDFDHSDIDDFFKDAEEVEKEEQPHIITCPHCGKMISLTKDFHIIEDKDE